MDFRQLVQNSVGNIQNELAKILTFASLFGSGPSAVEASFHDRVVLEYNCKLHKMRSENTRLNEKNKALSERVKSLEARLCHIQRQAEMHPMKARPFKGDGAMKQDAEIDIGAPLLKKRTLSNDKASLEILSSPIKQSGTDRSKKSSVKRVLSSQNASYGYDLTSSQFDRLATQYSDANSQPESCLGGKGPENLVKNELSSLLRASSPNRNTHHKPIEKPDVIIRGSFASDDESNVNNSYDIEPVVPDSQDKFEPLGIVRWSPSKVAKSSAARTISSSKAQYHSHCTALQRVEFLRNYFRPMVSEKRYRVDFSRNPITEKKWALEDFVPNQNWKPPKKINYNLGVLTKAQEKIYNEFFNKAGLGQATTGPVWNSDERLDCDLDGATWVRSQIMDKYLSPPGYMVGDFTSTHEAEERKFIREEKEHERIKRRFKSAISQGEFLFYETVFNDFVRAGKYVNGP